MTRRIPKRHASSARAASSLALFFRTDRWTERRKKRRKPKGMLCRGEAVSGRGPGIGGERSRGCYDAKWVASMKILNRVYIGRSISRRWQEMVVCKELVL